MQEEREERELRRAEMEATKAENMVEHGAEIAARPPKTWFQSTREKAAAADRSAGLHEGGAAALRCMCLWDTSALENTRNSLKQAEGCAGHMRNM